MKTRALALMAGLSLTATTPASAQQPTPAPAVTRTDLLSQTLPTGDFREIKEAVVELAPGAAAIRHRHDVAVIAYVLEGTVENSFNGGATQVMTAGQSWYEAPGTVHDVARNTSTTTRARLLIVYIGEPGKPTTVPLR